MGVLFFRDLTPRPASLLGELKHYSLKAVVTTFPCNAGRTIYYPDFSDFFSDATLVISLKQQYNCEANPGQSNQSIILHRPPWMLPEYFRTC